MKVLSLFDGISSGRLALERAGIPVEKYYASEIDKYAIQVAQKNYPDTIQVGDVNKLNYLELLDVDMVIGGSPCQDLSIAKQNRQGLRGERSGLFWKYVEALEVIHPKWFLLENVASMRNEDRDAITETLKRIYPETECIMINSALVSAQQRKRYYWTNWHIEQPQDKGILLKHILENGCELNEKSHCLDANYHKGTSLEHYAEKRNREIVAVPCAMRTREDELGKFKRVETKDDGKANSLTSVQTDSMVAEPVRIGELNGLSKAQGNRIYSVRGKSVCLNANGGGGGAKTGLYKIDLPDGDYIIRKLTPVECARLQTMPDHWCDGISATQQYKCYGNGWTVDVIAWIFSQLPN
jgi:DNA (cytosine-5)-methyltransferase 3A